LGKGPVKWAWNRRRQAIPAESGKKKSGCSGEADRYPHFLKISRLGVDNYFFDFSVLHNY